MKLFAYATGIVEKISDSNKSVIVSIPAFNENHKDIGSVKVRCLTDIAFARGFKADNIVGKKAVVCFKYHKKRTTVDGNYKDDYFILPHVIEFDVITDIDNI